jgi:ketosteroid isomerase-like protein
LSHGINKTLFEQRRRTWNRRKTSIEASNVDGDAADDANDDDDDESKPSTSSSSSSSSTTPDIATLRSQLEAAVEAEDYALAAKIRDSLRALEDDAVAGVTEANARFYAAFRAADIDVMASCLGEGDHVTVIHPGCNAIRGREAVLESWRVIFSGATRAAGKGAAVALDIEAVEMKVYAPPLPSGSGSGSGSESDSPASSSSGRKGTGAIGVVTCVERVDGGDATGRVVATNVFERGGDGRYRMILHHGSSAPPMRR